jgi:NAD(P)-dependent dehydrogenase (short-subunit alcohol dehydrogenase family)
MDDRTPSPRRAVIAAAPALLAAAATGGPGAPAAAQPAPAGPPAYPRPPFPRQEQPWPGLAARMVPRPDHGEDSYRGSGRLAGRRALVTGGDSGIGRAAAIAFAREGADVALNYLPEEEEDAQEVVRLVRAAGRQAVALPGDIRDEAFCQQLVAAAAARLGGLDLLVNNAGRQQAARGLEALSTEAFDATMKTNLYAMFWITRAALAHLPAGAAIINTASVVAYNPPPGLLDYTMTKAAIIAFTRSLAKQLVAKGIRVNAVAPGAVWTPLQPSGGQFPESLPNLGMDAPIGRPAQPAEIAPLFVMLAAAESGFVTGGVHGAAGGGIGP